MKGSELYKAVVVLAGTQSHREFSSGNILPIAAQPFGLTHWTVQTAEGSWFFNLLDRKMQGFRATHQPSPWMGDYGSLVVMPMSSKANASPYQRASAYTGTFKPHGIKTRLIRYGITAELRPGRASAFLDLVYDDPSDALFLIEGIEGKANFQFKPDMHEVWVKSTNAAGGVVDGFGCYYVIRTDAPFEVVKEEAGRVILKLRTTGSASVMMGSSFIGFEQARLNLLNDHNNVNETEQKWAEIFDRFEVQSEDISREVVFATCLYRAHLFPRETHEYDHKGDPYHYSFVTGKVEPGVGVTDNGFWDTYRTVVPWHHLTRPSRASLALNGWLSFYKEGGWFPQWASPGYRACMVGTHIDAVFADAAVKGVPGVDYALALEGMVKHATKPGDKAGAYGRLGIADYLARGYVSEETVEASVARSLDYAYDDFCIAQVARAVGKPELAKPYEASSKQYSKLYDPSVGFMRARHADGKWAKFSEFEWGGPYVEGGPWQGSWAVQHDPSGLIQLNGGPEKTVEKLEKMLTMEPKFEVGHYGVEIHEMTEMAKVPFGQYAHSNQPVHHVLYLFNEAGRVDRANHYIHRVLNELYTPDSFCGDEDNGEMASWYLWASLGLFPFCPGRAEYHVNRPLFKYARVRLESGAEIVVKSSGDGSKGYSVNGARADGFKIDHATVARGVTIEHA